MFSMPLDPFELSELTIHNCFSEIVGLSFLTLQNVHRFRRKSALRLFFFPSIHKRSKCVSLCKLSK